MKKCALLEVLYALPDKNEALFEIYDALFEKFDALFEVLYALFEVLYALTGVPGVKPEDFYALDEDFEALFAARYINHAEKGVVFAIQECLKLNLYSSFTTLAVKLWE